MAKYLDNTGLQYFWGKVKAYVDAKKSEMISDISRSGETFTATRADGTTFTFTQKDDDTWVPNTVNTDGYVAAPTVQNANRVWKTDGNGVPGWRQESGGGSGGSLPSGGTIGQLLAKASGLDNDTIWKTLTALDIGALPTNADTDHALVMRDQSDTSEILTVDWDGSVVTRSTSHAGTERPTSNTPLQKIDSYDSEGANVGYAQIVLTSGGVYRSYAVRNPTTGEAMALYLRAYDNGTKQLTLSSDATIADAAIPSLAASKIGSGTLNADRIPTLAIGTKTSGTLARDRGGTGVTGRQSSTVTLSNSNATTNHCWHNGVVATVTLGTLRLASALSNGSSRTVGTVPSGYRPVDDVIAVCGTNADASTGKVFVIIHSSGTITLYNRSGASLGTGVNMYLTVTYVI